MPIEQFTLSDVHAKSLKRWVRGLEKQDSVCVQLTVPVQAREKTTEVLCALRSANISVLLLVSAENSLLEDDEMIDLFEWLRTWDQLSLRNFMELCGNWVPQDFGATLEQESKTEFKWFQEWQTAIADPRVHRYPTLPWRSFVRRINHENFSFALDFLEIVALPSSEENRNRLQIRAQAFIEAKKKAICIFPKKWGEKMKAKPKVPESVQVSL